MIDIVLMIGLIGLVVSMLGGLYRVFMGPSSADRVVALDTIGINLIGMTALLSIMMDTHVFVNVILLIGILSFIGTVSFSKFLGKGVIIERSRR